MKLKIAKIIAGALASVGIVAQATAQSTNTNDVYIVGSTDFRAVVYTLMHDTSGNGMFGPNPYVETTYGNGTPSLCSQMMWEGTVTNAGPVRIKFSWMGSIEGVHIVTSGAAVSSFPADFPTDVGGNFPSVTPGSTPSDYTISATNGVGMCLSDCFQRSTLFTSPTLTNDLVAVVPYLWIKNNGTNGDPHWDGLTNVEDQLLRTVLAGAIPLSQFTGSASDWDGLEPLVYVLGRDDDSGTRLQAFAETGFGIYTDPLQYDITGSGPGNINIVEDAQTTDPFGFTVPFGSQGYSSPTALAQAMSIAGSSAAADTNSGGTGWYAIAYLGLADANPVISSNAVKALTYNGFPYSTNSVQNGQYDFWGYEHILSSTNLTGTSATIKSRLKTLLTTQYYESSSGTAIELSSMNVTRVNDGSNPTHN